VTLLGLTQRQLGPGLTGFEVMGQFALHLVDRHFPALRVPLWALFLPRLPDDIPSLRRADRLTRTYLAISEDGKRTIDGIAEAEARYHAVKLPK
jgi:hypothetical protein